MRKNDLLSKMAEFRIEGNLHTIMNDDDSFNSIKAAIANCEDEL